MSRAEALAARLLHEPQLSKSINNQPIGLGFPHHAGQYRPRGTPFSSRRYRKLQADGSISCPGMRYCSPRVRLDLDFAPRGNSRRALAP